MRIPLTAAILSLVPLASFAEEPKPCVFCEIVAGTRQQEAIVYRDATVVAFLSIGPRNPGHTLIVPVEHSENLNDLPAETMHHMTDVAKLIVDAIKRTDIKMDGFRLEMANGKAAGQSVMHAHLHVIPRYEGEPEEKHPHDRVGPEVLAPIAAKIRAALPDS